MVSRVATALVAQSLAPLDALRAQLYRLCGRGLARWVRDRELRVAALGVASVAVALALSIRAPLWLLALGPIVLGVPHVLADVRYLWVQPRFHREPRVWWLVVPLIAAGAITADVLWGLLAAFAALFAVPSSWRRRAIGGAGLLPLVALSAGWPAQANLVFAHAHNLVALVLWWLLWPRRARWHFAVVALFAAAMLLVGAGAFDGALADLSGRHLRAHAASLAPFASGPWAARIVVSFAFAQAVHYAIWLRLIPEDARRRPSPRPFRSSFAALCRELGLPLLVFFGAGTLVFAVWALVDLWSARDGYLRAAIFHGHLELAAAALLFARGRRPARGA